MATNLKITTEDSEALFQELDRYKDQVSFYKTKRKKDGVFTHFDYGIAFYYEETNGKKERKSFSGKENNHKLLLEKRQTFLTELYYEKQKLIQEAEDMKLYNLRYPSHLLKQEPTCDKTVNEAIDLYLPTHKARVKYATHIGEENSSKHVRKWLGDKKVCDLIHNDFQNLLNEVAKGRNGKRAHEKSVKTIKGFFKRLIRYCKKQGWLSADKVDLILEDVYMPVTARKEKNAKYLPIEDMGKVLNTLQGNTRYYLIAKILLLTGMRGQEIFALKKQDLLPEEGLISINSALEVQEQLRDTDRRFRIGETKNEESDRYAPAIPEVFECFKELEEIQVSMGWREKSYNKGFGDLAIIDSKGQLVNKTCFNRNLNAFLTRRGSKKLTLHMPRHCYTTYLKFVGANSEDVEFSLGHAMSGVRYVYLAEVRSQYIKSLLPKIEEMAEKVKKAEKGEHIEW